METTEKIIKNVDLMRQNAMNQAIHHNLSLARETLSLLKNLDDPDEGPLGKALACNAMLEQLSQYDTPRFVLELLRQEKAWLEESDEKSDNLTAEDVQRDIERLEDYIDCDDLSMEEFCHKWDRHLLFDPVERTQKWEDIWFDVEEECDRMTANDPRGMGFCFGYWAAKHSILKKYGIDWKSPHMMNPRVIFD